MLDSIRYVGLDVHADSISIAVAQGRENERFVSRIANDFPRVVKALDRLGDRGSLRCAYEAGPTGYGLCRSLREAGISCQVIAPSKMPKCPGDRVKTDRRDCKNLAHLLRCGSLASVHVPEEADEAMRDLLRAREAAKQAQTRARHQLGKFLLRHGRRWQKSNWTIAHLDWIERQRFEHGAQQRVLQEYIQAVHESTDRIKRHDALLEELAPQSEHAEMIEALQAFRGIRLLVAASIVFELSDLRRFKTPTKLMGYLGLTPSEDSSGDRVRRGRITRAGNAGLRRLLVESAWAYRHQPRVSYALRRRSEGVAPRVKSIAWKAQLRLHAKYKKMMGRGKGSHKTLVALARELVGFIWSVFQESELVTD